MKNLLPLLILVFGLNSLSYAQKTYVPDDHFEQALIDLGLDDVLDDSVNTASIDTVTKLIIQFKDISDLTGIENFTALKKLDCYGNQLTTLDLTNNIKLEYLVCVQNKLNTLNISKCKELKEIDLSGSHVSALDLSRLTKLSVLNCSGNRLTALNVSNNPLLKHLNCQNNPITSLNLLSNPIIEYVVADNDKLSSLDLPANHTLRVLLCRNNKLKTLNLYNNTALGILYCFDNHLESLNISNDSVLTDLLCYNNQLTNLDLSTNKKLRFACCGNNQLTTLDASKNLKLLQLYCSANNLVSLKVNNGKNKNMQSFDARNNPDLKCIQVDDAAWSTAHWPNKDATATYSDHCNCCGTDTDSDGVPDNMDDYPNDATRAFNNYFPATGFGSLGFEDLWPGKGDYDFNDVVVDYRFQTVTNASNEVVEIFGKFVAKASGASLENGFGFNLPDASTTLSANQQDITVTGFNKQESYIRLNSNGLEQNQSKPTVIVFGDIFDVLPIPGSGIGVNTNPNAAFVPFDTLTVKMVTTGTVKYTAADFSLETWNPFIIVNREREKEIHLPNHAPTDLADPSYFKTMEDDSDPAAGRYYKTIDNQPWAIDVVSEYSWPIEKVNIGDAYLHFVKWAETSGTEFPDWYKNKPGYRDESKIYVVPAK